MARIKFLKGEQRKFIDKVVGETEMPSLRALLSLGISTNYSTLKNYHNESRLLSEEIFNELLILSRLSKNNLSFEILEDNWGRVKGGKKSKRK